MSIIPEKCLACKDDAHVDCEKPEKQYDHEYCCCGFYICHLEEGHKGLEELQ